MELLPRSFYGRDGLTVARDLLGKVLVCGDCAGIIVETEAYMAPMDRASHAFGGRRTLRTEPLFGPPGHAYIYLTYGMYHCLNAVCAPEGEPQCVLIRALEPIRGLEHMAARRRNAPTRDLCRGPGRLCMALGLDRSRNTADLCAGDFCITEGDAPGEIVTTPRIGVDNSGEAAQYPWRFCCAGNRYVSHMK